MLLIGTALPTFGMINETFAKDNELTKINCIYEDNNCYGDSYQGIFFKNPGFVITEDSLFSNIEEKKPKLVETPDYFNWMDYNGEDYTSPANNQGGCGSCWAFAALGTIESIINIREEIPDLDIDLSEQFVLSCLHSGNGCDGGNVLWALRDIMEHNISGIIRNGIIPEACFPYKADDTIPCDDKWDNWEEFLIPIVDCGRIRVYGNPDDREIIKSQIMQTGPVGTSMSASGLNFTVWGYTHHSPDDYFPYEEKGALDHCVLIVGWKDDPSIGNGGYWIVKNSWGPNFGYNGFFNIEYGNQWIDGYEIVWVEYDPESYNWQPVPKINGPYYGLTNEPIQFQGDAAGENPPFTWYWDFGDGAISEEQNPTHSYAIPGVYVVNLTVTDDNGDSFPDSTWAWVQETNQPPSIPVINCTVEIKEDEFCWYNITFDDPDGSVVYLYAVAFGFESNIWWGPYSSEWGKEYLYYSWPEKGTFEVKAKTKDPYGLESDWATLEVIVSKTKSKEITMFEQLIDRLIERHPILEILFK